MKFLKQHTKLDIINLDKIISKNPNNKQRHSDLLPSSIRAIICGPSNCGKTNLMLNLIFSPKGLFFENIYLYSKSLYQEKYVFLQSVFEKIKEIGFFPYTENNEVPHPSDVKPNSIMIFDDVACEKQQNIKNYFSMGRHNKVDSFYICQTYSYIPKQLVRDNANLLVIFKQDDRNLRHIYHDHINTDMNFDQFKKMCSKIWNKGHNSFLVIDKESDVNNGRYRCGFDIYITL